PIIFRTQLSLPLNPNLARIFSEQILLLKAHRQRKLKSTFTNQKHMVGVFHYFLSHPRGVLDSFKGSDSSGAAGWSMHDRSIELNHPLLVREPTISDRTVLGILLHQVDPCDNRVQCVRSLLDQLHRPFGCAQTVATRDHDGSSLPGRLCRGALRQAETGDAGSRRSDEITTIH